MFVSFLTLLFASLFAEPMHVVHRTKQQSDSQQDFNSVVGFPARINQIILPGTELVSQIESRTQPIVVRVIDSYQHGDGYRYDLEYYGLEPGQFDLRKYLSRRDGSTVDDLPQLIVSIQAILPAGQIEPHEPPARQPSISSFYLATLVVGSGVWLLGMFAILFIGRGRIRHIVATSRTITVADRLRPLIERAVSGELSSQGQAELERVLVAFWRKKLRLDELPPSQLFARLKEHEPSRMILSQLEEWLHRPGSSSNMDVARLLAPYQSMAAEELE
jgi:hypothetical protein